MSLIARLVEGQVGIIERNGKYLKTIFPGALHIIVPAIDKLFIYDLKAKTFNMPKISILLKNSFTIDVEAVVKYKIMEPWKARYEVENNDLEYSIERLFIKTLSSNMNSMTLEEAVGATEDLTDKARKHLDNISRQWGFKLIYVEIKSIKKSFLAEQEKEKLYDIHKGEKGSFMSEKVDAKDSSKVIHAEEEDSSVNFTQMTNLIEDASVEKLNKEISNKIEELETQIETGSEGEMKDLQLQQLEIYKDHQREMLKLHEKDIKKQQEELMFEITQLAQKQEELFKKQQSLLSRQEELEKKKQEVDCTDKALLEQTNVVLQELAEKDALTKLYNRRYFEDEIVQRLKITSADKQILALLMLDVDYFKSINDNHGHNAGDEALKLISKVLLDSTEPYDLVCRYGGEEFAILHVVSAFEEAYILANKIRKAIESMKFKFNNQEIKMTISIGIAFNPPQSGMNHKQLVHMADTALYKAKKDGRNRCIVFSVKENEEQGK